jgi:hypothetical protein
MVNVESIIFLESQYDCETYDGITVSGSKLDIGTSRAWNWGGKHYTTVFGATWSRTEFKYICNMRLDKSIPIIYNIQTRKCFSFNYSKALKWYSLDTKWEPVILYFQHPTSGPSFQLQVADLQGDALWVIQGGEGGRRKRRNQTRLLCNASDFDILF